MAEETVEVPSMGKGRLSGILFNHRRYNILAFLLNNPDSQYSIADIQSSVDVSRPIISEFVDELRDIGLVEKHRKGNMYLVSVNPDSPYFDALHALLELDAEPLQESARQVAQEIITHNEVVSVYLFGSVARGTPRIDSDIDILVVHTGEELEEDVKRKINAQVRRKEKEWSLDISPTYYGKQSFEADLAAGVAFPERIKEEGVHLAGEELW